MLSGISRISVMLALLTTFAATNADAAEPGAKEKSIERPDVGKIASSINEFGFELYGRLAEKEGSLFFSPASISSAMAMTYAGAEGETEAQMAKVLHFADGETESTREEFHRAYGSLTVLFNNDDADGSYQLSMANRLWGQNTFPFRPEFLATTRQNYGAELATIDFARTEQSRQEINAWVEEQTNGKIENLIPSDVLDVDTRMVLTNAIYFKGSWKKEFSEEATKSAPFQLSQGQKVEVPMMHQTIYTPHAETDDLQMIMLPYVGGDLSMIVILPKNADGLSDLERSLNPTNFREWTSGFRWKDVRLYLPKFRLTSQFKLADVLQELGMKLPFSQRADFSGISKAADLMLSEVVHKAFVDVNEKGTEAAAATAAVIRQASGIDEGPVTFNANRPFVFLIQDRRSEAVLFMGRVVNPQQ